MKNNSFIDGIYSTLSGNSSEKVSQNLKHLRLAKCKTCFTSDGRKMVTITGNCRKCGCFINLKTEYKEESCPLGKW